MSYFPLIKTDQKRGKNACPVKCVAYLTGGYKKLGKNMSFVYDP
jgi:hypothetical protein